MGGHQRRPPAFAFTPAQARRERARRTAAAYDVGMQLTTSAIVCAVLPHGENGAVARVLTPAHGLLAGYVRGGRSRRLRPVLGLGNTVAAELRARTDAQLPALVAELAVTRATLAFDPLGAAALEWLCALSATVLPEGQPQPALFVALEALLDAMGADPPLVWIAHLARFELSLLADLGFGLDLARCAGTGQAHDLAYVSPRARAAVSAEAGAPHADRLLRLPTFLAGDGNPPDWAAAADALAIGAHFIAADIVEGPAARILPARARLAALVERRAVT